MHVFVIFGIRKRSTEPTSHNGPANEFQKSAVFVFATGKKKLPAGNFKKLLQVSFAFGIYTRLYYNNNNNNIIITIVKNNNLTNISVH